MVVMKRLLRRFLHRLSSVYQRTLEALLNSLSSYKVGKVYNWRPYPSFNPVKVKLVEIYFDEYRGFSYGAVVVDEGDKRSEIYGIEVWCKLEELSDA